MKKIIFSLILLANTVFAQSDQERIINLVNSSMREQLSKIPVDKENNYGFKNRAEFNDCVAGNPIRVITLNNQDSVIETNEWRVPIIYQNEYRILFTVQIINNEFQVVDIGGAKLASELQLQNSNGFNVNYFLRLYDLKIDFIIDAILNLNIIEKRFIPLGSTSMYFLNKGETLNNNYSLEEIINLRKLNK